jgi:hydrogenase maturation protein HypF
MPGGDRSVKNIYTMAASYIARTYGTSFNEYLEQLPYLKNKIKDTSMLYRIIDRKINSPLTSSCGRLFDGVSGILGLCSTASYEGQGAVRLEASTDYNITDRLDYDIKRSDGMYIYDWRSTIENIMGLLARKADKVYISSAFHNTVVEAGAELCMLIREDTGINKVVLSGGVFQNDYILKKLTDRLKSDKFNVYIHNRVSTNDEGISLGQLVIAQSGGGLHVPCGTIKNNINR